MEYQRKGDHSYFAGAYFNEREVTEVRALFENNEPFQINTSIARNKGDPAPSTRNYKMIQDSRERVDEYLKILKKPDKKYDWRKLREGFVFASEWFPIEYQALVEQKTTKDSYLITLRKRIMEQTLACLKSKRFLSHEGKVYAIDRDILQYSATRTENITDKHLDLKFKYKCYPRISVEIYEIPKVDPLMHVKDLRMEGYDPCVFFAAHPNHPGGTYQQDAKEYSDGIEEDIYRRTTLYASIKDIHKFDGRNRMWIYQLPEFGGIYSPRNFLLRGPECEGYRFLKPKEIIPDDLGATSGTAIFETISFVMVSPVKKPKCEPIGKKLYEAFESERWGFFSGQQLKAKYEEKIMKKMETGLMIARTNGHDCVVIAGPFGAYKCPPFQLAALLQRLVYERFTCKGEYNFRKIVICCKKNLDATHYHHGTYNPFKVVFDKAHYMQEQNRKDGIAFHEGSYYIDGKIMSQKEERKRFVIPSASQRKKKMEEEQKAKEKQQQHQQQQQQQQQQQDRERRRQQNQTKHFYDEEEDFRLDDEEESDDSFEEQSESTRKRSSSINMLEEQQKRKEEEEKKRKKDERFQRLGEVMFQKMKEENRMVREELEEVKRKNAIYREAVMKNREMSQYSVQMLEQIYNRIEEVEEKLKESNVVNE